LIAAPSRWHRGRRVVDGGKLPSVSLRVCGSVITALAGLSRPLVAQATRPTSIWLLGLTAGFYGDSRPEGSPVGIGATVAVDRSVAPSVAIRISAGAMSTVMTADDIALCHLLPGGGCLPDAVFPERLWTLEGAAFMRPDRNGLVAVIIGAGVEVPQGARENERRASSLDSTAAPRPAWRAGVEVALGNRKHPNVMDVLKNGLNRLAKSFALVAASNSTSIESSMAPAVALGYNQVVSSTSGGE